uniref:PNPLA domain-containing protein n=1 Tax=viral metagenome TaxID=1070528 RepID=A0A6C0J7W1_9ZZZZ
MGNSSTKYTQVHNNLFVKARLLEKQIKTCTKLDPVTQSSILYVKQSRSYTSLVLPGGGLISLASIAVIEYLTLHGCMKNIKSIGASSFSAIVAVLYSIGVPINNIKKYIFEINWKKILRKTTHKPCDSDIYHTAHGYGESNGKLLHDTILSLILKHTGNKHYTLGDLKKDKGMTLILTAVDICSKSIVYFNTEQHSHVPLRVILRAVCGIPEIVSPIILDGYYLVDASILQQCSSYLFDTKPKSLKSSKNTDLNINPNNLSVRIIRDLPMIDHTLMSDITNQNKVIKPIKIKDYHTYSKYLLDITTSVQDDIILSPEAELRIITTHLPMYSITNTNINNDEFCSAMKAITEDMEIYFHGI